MSAVFMKVMLLLIISDWFGILNGEKLDHDKLPRQLLDLETFVHQKFQDVDRLLIEKDERIDQLQSIMTIQKTEIAQLKKGMASLEQDMVHRDGIVDRLVNRITELEAIVMLNSVQQEPELRQDTSQSTSWMNDRLDKFLSPDNSTTSTRQSTRLSSTVNRTGESPPLQDVTSYSDSRDGKLADPCVSLPTVVKAETKAEKVSGIKFPRPHQKRVAPPRTRRLTTPIAFHVALSAYHEYYPDNTVVYDNVKLDHGDGYNPGDGIYIVPESGTYVLTWTSICYIHNQFQTVLAVNGAYMGSSWTEASDVNDYHQTTAVVVLNLNQEDHVFIRMGNTNGYGRMVSNTGNGESTFSGWKLD